MQISYDQKIEFNHVFFKREEKERWIFVNCKFCGCALEFFIHEEYFDSFVLFSSTSISEGRIHSFEYFVLRNPGSECQIAISSREMAASFRHFIRYRKMWNSDLRTSQYSTFSFFNCPVEHISNSYYDRSLESLNVCSFLDIIDERYLPFLVKCTVVNFYSTSEIFSADAININEGYAKGVSRELIISFVCIVENSLFVMNESMESSIKLCFSNYSVHRIASNDIIILTTTNFVHLKFESLKDMEYVMLSVQNELEQTIEIDPNLNIQLHLMRNIIQDCCNELDSDSGFSSSDHKSCSLFVGNIYLPMISMNMWFSLFSYCCHMDKLLPKAILSLHYSSFLLCIQKRNFLLGKSCNNKLVYAMLNNGSLVFFHCSSNGTIDLESYDECSLKFAVCSRSLDCSMFEFTIASIDGVWTFRCGSSIEFEQWLARLLLSCWIQQCPQVIYRMVVDCNF